MLNLKRVSNILLIFSFYFQFIFIQSYITIPFEYINKDTNTIIPNITTVVSYFESYFENSIFSILKVNNQNIKFHITFDRYATYISNSTLEKLGIKPSLTYDEEKEIALYSLEYIGIPRTTFGYSSFDFLQNSTKNININNLYFFISQRTLSETTSIKKAKCLSDTPEEIGFNIYKGNKISEVYVEQDDPFEDYYPSNPGDDIDHDNDDDYEYGDYPNQGRNNRTGERYINKNNGYEIEEKSNLVNQLKSLKLISSYVFSIKYDNNEDKGQIIIGSLPHEYDPRHFSEKYFVYSSIVFKKETPAWRLIFDDIEYGSEKLISSKLAEFSINFGFILCSSTNKQVFDVNFFLKPEYAEYCREEKIGNPGSFNTYYVKYCKEKVIKEFKSVKFYLPKAYNGEKSEKIELNYKDLFVKCPGFDNVYCFQIIFGSMSSAWILGKPLFKKHQMIFDQEKKVVGFYKEIGEYDIQENVSKGNFGHSLPWILVGILVLCLAILGTIFYKKLPFIKRKKIANELEDDFVYELAVKKNQEENEKNKIFNS